MATTTINGRTHTIQEQDLNKNLLAFLREDLDLTGAKNACGIGVCGACSILVGDRVVRACKQIVNFIVNKKVLTIEGMTGENGQLHPLQQSFIDNGAIQCGFCTPGMVLTSHAFLLKNNNPTREDIRKAISANLCRCTGYQQIVDAIMEASEYYKRR
jgi:carbon-monoxide dehydrogenase small subunit